MIQFLIGAVVGGVAAWQYRDDIRRYMDQKLPDVRLETSYRGNGLGGTQFLRRSGRWTWPQSSTRRWPRSTPHG